MRKFLIVAVFTLALFGTLAPPVHAQAPAPKVTITGLFDQITAMGANFYDGNFARTSDREWYARTRFRPDFKFEVGRTKAVLGFEIDMQYGQSGPNDGGFPGNVSGAAGGVAGGSKVGATGTLDLNTDVAGMIEVKWIYTEFDLTGKDSLLPFIPVQTVARAGGQPWGTLANYWGYGKSIYAIGDFAGVSAVTTWAPNLLTKLAYAQVEEELAGGNRGGALARVTRGGDFAVIASAEYTPLKGLSIQPLYSLFYAEGMTNGVARRAATNRFSGTAGGATTAAAATWGGGNPNGATNQHETRHTIGFDGTWRSGPWGFDPTVLYQFGTRDVQCLCPNKGAAFSVQRVETDMSSYLVDLIGSFRTGPFVLEVRGVYSPGNKARDNLAKSIRYYDPLSMDGTYYYGWAQIVALSNIDYLNGLGGVNGGMSYGVGYDRYGRAQLGVRGSYNMTPALRLYAIVNPTFTAEKVDTDSGQGPFGVFSNPRTIVSDKSFVEGDSRYIGTEGDLGVTWRFAPNVSFDVMGGYLWAGSALDVTEILNGVATKRQAQDAWTIASKVSFSF